VKRALISDIHANLEALEAVLKDISERGIKEIYCLGDMVGYGPNPNECVDLVIAKCQVAILGNHDQAVLFDPENFNPLALQAAYWTRSELESGSGGSRAVAKRWEFIGELPRLKDEGEFLFVHGSPRDPTNEYVFPEDVYNTRKMESLFGKVKRYCFQGHTHLPGVFTDRGEFYSPSEVGHLYQLTDQKVMINVGSVGQPRDGDNRACYTIIDGDQIHFVRVNYPFDQTASKIYGIPDLGNMLGDRLRSGR
jgi:predicted phosphodiesterase